MYSELKCPACGGTIAVDVHSEVIVCDTCGKAYKNPFYQPMPEVVEVEEPMPVVEEPATQEQTAPVEEEQVVEQEPQTTEESAQHTQAEVTTDVQDDVATDEPTDVVTDETVDEDVWGTTTEQEPVDSEPASRAKKTAKTHAKPSKKHVMSVVKASICLLLAVMMFAFSFCPISGERFENNIEGFSGTDYIGLMFCTARHWSEENEKDVVKMEKLEEKMEKLYEEMEGLDSSCTESPSGKIYYKAEYARWYHKYSKLSIQEYLSLDGYVTDVQIAQITFIGIASLLHVLFSGGMMILSAIALVISILNLVKNEDKKFFFEKFYRLFPLGLFLSLAVLFGASVMNGASFLVSGIAASFIARLFFECLAFALVIAERVVYIVKNKVKVRDWAFKALAIALSIVAVGCCFAPAFYARYTDEGDDVKIVNRYKDTAYVLGVGAITQELYEKVYADMEHQDFLDEVAEEIEDNDMNSAISLVLIETSGASAGALSTGYFFMLLAVIALGGFATAQLFDEKQSVLARKILAIIAVAFMLAAFICAIVLVATFNDFTWEIKYVMENEEVKNFKYMLDGGVVCAFLISVMALLSELLPEKLLPRKEEESQGEPTIMQEDFEVEA